jgi:tRNA(Ile)-lysidine synthase
MSGPGEGDLDLTEKIRARGLLADGRPVVAMLSGGRDSVCLLDLASAVAGPSQVIALHVNYGLRDGAGHDEALCRQLCAELGVQLEVVNAGSSPESGNLQAWARDLRYATAREIAGGAADIATGHTATDQVETILYRLAAAPSRRALLGMVERDGQLIRPLLFYTREQTAAHCRARGLPWREDPSNDTDRFARGRVRNELVPALRRVHPAAEANVLALAEILRQEGEMLDELVARVLRGRDEIPLAELRELPLPLARLVLQRLADAAAGRPAPGTARRAAEILGLGNRARLDLPHGVRAVVERGRLSFSLRCSAARAPRPRTDLADRGLD